MTGVITLGVSTAEQGGSLAIVNDSRLLCEEYWNDRQTHSKRLLVMIEHLIKHRAGLQLEEIDAFVAARGPGSFTGLRIGISVIKGLAYACQKPEIGVSTLDGIAYRLRYSNLPVCVMMDAKREEVYTAVYRFDRGRLTSKSPESVVSPEKAVSMVNGPAIFTGSGSKAYQDIISSRVSQPVVTSACFDHASAAALIHAASLQAESEHHTQPFLVEPVYLRKSDAEMNASKG